MIAIISCSARKIKRNNIKARDLYWASALFRYSYKHIKKYYPDVPIYILSSKYGLIPEDKIVNYYSVTLKEFNKEELSKFCKRIRSNSILIANEYIFIGGKKYKEVLGKEPLVNIGGGLPIGKKLSFLKEYER